MVVVAPGLGVRRLLNQTCSWPLLGVSLTITAPSEKTSGLYEVESKSEKVVSAAETMEGETMAVVVTAPPESATAVSTDSNFFDFKGVS